MEQLPRLRARISSLHELQDLVGALRALAASHVREAQSALAGIRRYAEVVEDAIAQSADLLPMANGIAALPQSPDASVLIVVCSEHGFVGAFNERILDRALAERKARQELVIIGQRGAMLADERGVGIDRSFPMATHVGGILAVTRRVAEHLAIFSTADVVFGGYRRGGTYDVQLRSILPLDPSVFTRSKHRSRPLHHLPPDDLIERLASEYLFSEITRVVMESLASENGARLSMMESADHNIGDKLDTLGRQEHSLRQEAITSELLDVVTGSEAILKSGIQ